MLSSRYMPRCGNSGSYGISIFFPQETFIQFSTAAVPINIPTKSVGMFSSVQSLSRVWLFVIPWTVTHQASLSITSSWGLLKLMSIESVTMGLLTFIKPSHLLSSPSAPALKLFQYQGLFKESVPHIRWPKYWSFTFSISPSNEYSGLISFRMDWLDIFVVQVTLKSLL